MPLKGKGLTSKNAHRRKKSPTIEQPSLAWRKVRLLNRDDEAVVRYIAVNHDVLSGSASDKQMPSTYCTSAHSPNLPWCVAAHVPGGNKTPLVQLTVTCLISNVNQQAFFSEGAFLRGLSGEAL